MRILLDECIPRKFKRCFTGHDCRTAHEEGWAGRTNGELLKLAEKSGFQIFLTLDRGIEHQQRLSQRSIGILLISAKTNRLADLLPQAPKILSALESVKPGQVCKVG